ncbi:MULTISPECIES: daunorubicin/doxorubicin resistance ABC transporter ATP-binding protein DrrA [Streptomyces]|uniref:ABC-type xenobiotic transporter n=4 Tax=Streptomyces venezuelae TaxID=54571 RepID=F2RA73_STRVP|nr:daunorubicin/doxorubicin resistance ABC transporter ATP-binding protein DrrA [Streptomyces venezuelae]APE22385.1 daunorubicin/doxorubicin resistance ABC transporter ATP-binding protein DrrA [Streptomyces venezuelae]QER99769.1 daunorubicin/doxorubicin resistance ABC transporter ATP-binding protein DrrA [Streptomyces venezuelae ATCC 10712]CCA56555.1 putative ABC transporter ATP-binding protein [Streptomyces venezuelae ATCC 10712]
MAATQDAILVEGARKRYGEKEALAGLDLTVRRGTVHGLLGPNGAGKTTTVRILATLLRHDEGLVRVAGHDVRTGAREVRRRIGLLGQHAALDEELGGRQNLEMFGRLHHLGARRAGTRAEELLERFGLTDTGHKPVKQFSGGMRRRLDLAASLITEPEVLFLDEPTTGLDPRGRGEVWESVRSLVGGGTTVLLTTQYLEEADQLADRISVVDRGRVVADGTPDELKALVGVDRIDVVVRDGARLDEAAALLPFARAEVTVDGDRRRLSAPVADRMASLTETVRVLGEAGIEAEDIALRRPTLDEVFLRLTGGGDTPDGQDATGGPDGTGEPGTKGAPGGTEAPGGRQGREVTA